MENAFSKKRMKFYREFALKKFNNEKLAQQCYFYNIKISSILYAHLSIFEVVLRNKIAKHLSDNFQNWFLNDSNFNQRILSSRESNFIRQANERLAQDEKKITEDSVISELTLGFWVTLFKKHNSQSVWSIFKYKNLFSGEFKKKKISEIYKILNDIRYIRNRISHYEQIITYYPEKTIKNVEDVLLSMDENSDKIITFLTHLSSVPSSIQDLNDMMEDKK